MSRTAKRIAITLVLAVILIAAVAGTALASNPEKGRMNQSQTGENVCNDDCEPIKNEYNYSWAGRGPHGQQNGKGPYMSQNGKTSLEEEAELPEY